MPGNVSFYFDHILSALRSGRFGARRSASAHQNERAFGEWRVQQNGSKAERQAVADLRYKQEGSQSPEFIQGKNQRKQAKKFFSQPGGIERRGRHEIEADR